jgi:choline dehydrogenase-like flavoprotein
MLVDARSLPTGTVIETEVCIVGAGAAGITVAREFTNSSHRVVLLESGDTEFRETTQKLYAGSNIGRLYFNPDDVDLRLRYFGGTTNHWAGWCAVPDPLDFEMREGIPYSGWPFSRTYLEPWYRRAQTVLQLGPYGYACSDWGIEAEDIPPPFNGPHFICQVLQLSAPTRFGPAYTPELRRASGLTVYLNANALRFNAGESDHKVQDLSVGVLPDRRLTVRAQIYVLAVGGIENARLLLLSGKEDGPALGNDQDLVGRFFMTHLNYPGGVIALANPQMDFKFQVGSDGAFYNRSGVPRRFVSYLCLSEDSRRKLQLPGLRIIFEKPPIDGSSEQSHLLQDLRSVMADIYGGTIADVPQDLRLVMRAILGKAQFDPGTLLVHCTSEQTPNPDSRIGLSSTTDAFGLRNVTIDWQLTAQNKQGMAAGHRLLGAEVGRAGFGRFRSSVTDDDVTWPKRMVGDEHNIGTTRMHRDPRCGVVDENCRVHGVANLYVAGSSVFPTEGTANPTLTIVALALRLADHIKERFT